MSMFVCSFPIFEWSYFCMDMDMVIPHIFTKQYQMQFTGSQQLWPWPWFVLPCSIDEAVPEAFFWHLTFIWHLIRKNICSTVWKMEIVKDLHLTCTLPDDLHLRDEALILWLAVVAAASDGCQCLAELMWFPSSLISAVYCFRRKGQQIDLVSV